MGASKVFKNAEGSRESSDIEKFFPFASIRQEHPLMGASTAPGAQSNQMTAMQTQTWQAFRTVKGSHDRPHQLPAVAPEVA